MEMTRTDFARWIFFAVICWVATAAYAGSPIGVIVGGLYVLIACTATIADVVGKRGGNEEE